MYMIVLITILIIIIISLSLIDIFYKKKIDINTCLVCSLGSENSIDYWRQIRLIICTSVF